jgi:hypothetical protein
MIRTPARPLLVPVCFLVFFLLGVLGVQGVQLDIHLKLDAATNDLVMKLGREITKRAPHNQVDFFKSAEPHVTLYLADFPTSHVPDLIQTVKEATSLFHRCPVTLNETVVSGSFHTFLFKFEIFINVSSGAGSYMLWNADVTPCLQNLSDTAVLVSGLPRLVDVMDAHSLYYRPPTSSATSRHRCLNGC